MWAAMQAGQEQNLRKKEDLDFKTTELRACLADLSDPDLSFDLRPAAASALSSSPPEPSQDVDVERSNTPVP